jgi:hypothetical protein
MTTNKSSSSRCHHSTSTSPPSRHSFNRKVRRTSPHFPLMNILCWAKTRGNLAAKCAVTCGPTNCGGEPKESCNGATKMDKARRNGAAREGKSVNRDGEGSGGEGNKDVARAPVAQKVERSRGSAMSTTFRARKAELLSTREELETERNRRSRWMQEGKKREQISAKHGNSKRDISIAREGHETERQPLRQEDRGRAKR